MAKEDYWPNFGVAKYTDIVDCTGGSIADRVLAQYIPGYSSKGIGGPLKNLDIKHMDALTTIKLSLLDGAAAVNGTLYELIVDEGGEIDFIEVGKGSPGTLNIYYTIQTQSWIDDVVGVLVTGGKPLPIRKEIGSRSTATTVKWTPIWGDGENSSKVVYNTQEMTSNCLTPYFDQYATIVYNDPHLDSSFEDGINNLYEITKNNPWDRIAGYVYYLNPGEYAHDDVTIKTERPCSVPIKVDHTDIPELIRPPTYPAGSQPECWVNLGEEATWEDGVKIEIDSKLRFTSVRDTTVDKLMEISKVFIIGQELDICKGIPEDDVEAVSVKGSTEKNTEIWVYAQKATRMAFTLQNGVHYAIAWKEEEGYRTPYIVLANNARVGDNAKYGTDATIHYIPHGALYTGTEYDTDKTVIPTGGLKGIIVEELWAVATLDSPSITIHDPQGNAVQIAADLEFEVAPIIIVEEPAPIAYESIAHSGLVNLEDSITDHDPTTDQDLDDTELEEIMDDMEGGGLSLSFSFMDESEVQQLSRVLYDHMKSRTGVETTYVCGPDSTPKLGAGGANGGIINSITYSYNDSGSYTISVNEGPLLIGGLTEVSGGIYMKQVEEFSAQGTIIQDAGNHIEYKVRIDGFGERWAINCCASVLRVGDKVSCAVHNNPVED